MKKLLREHAEPVIILSALCVLSFVMWHADGCSLLKSAQSAPANQTITEVIASAGAAANTAAQMYQSGQIPQTATARTAINDLGNAYNDAKTAYLAVLTAETTYQAAVNTQLTACAPTSSTAKTGTNVGSATTCQTATVHATSQKAELDSANATLSSKVSALTAKVTAVKALTPAK